jgi:WD40 repeat protein
MACQVYTTSYDCTIRSLSFTTEIAQEIYVSEDNILITHVDLTPTGHEMWISDGIGGATHLDLREGKSRARRFTLSDNKIGCISINPTRPNFILTASNNRTLKYASTSSRTQAYSPSLSNFHRIWDVRKLQILSGELSDTTLTSGGRKKQTTTEFDHETVTTFATSKEGVGLLRGEWPHDKSCSSAYWDPRGRQIVSTSYDDTLRREHVIHLRRLKERILIRNSVGFGRFDV